MSSSWPEPLSGKDRNTSTNTRISATLKVGAIALCFLVLGYQICLFIQRVAVMRVAANRDHPDTVFVYLEPAQPSEPTRPAEPTKTSEARRVAKTVKAEADHSEVAKKMQAQSRKPQARRKAESFRFNPNEATLEEFMRLGFSEKQAQSIINYRLKGGRFSRPSDFAKSYVVADSVYQRLEPYIDIPRVDINSADSAAFDALPGIGPWFAAKMVEYRRELGGYGSTRQLLDIYRFDEERYAAIEDLICCERPVVTEFWSLSEDSLSRHPAIRRRQTAHSIELWRRTMPRERWTLEELRSAGVLDGQQYERLSRCLIGPIGGDDAPE